MIRHLWTHKTQDHPVFSDEELMIERGEGVYIWTRSGKKLIDGFAGLAVVHVGHGRAEIADAIREQAAVQRAERSIHGCLERAVWFHPGAARLQDPTETVTTRHWAECPTWPRPIRAENPTGTSRDDP